MTFTQRMKKFFHETRVELKKVHWPTRKEFVRFFIIVLSAIIIVGVFFSILDYGLTNLVEWVVT